jgi:transcriptional regulator with XRE-family HTH domain
MALPFWVFTSVTNMEQYLQKGDALVLCERLKERRNFLGMTLVDVGERLGVTRGTVSRWETGDREPSDAIKKKLAEIYNTSVAYLLGETDEPSLKEPSLKVRNIPYDDWVKVPIFSRMDAACAGDGWSHEQIDSEIDRFEFLPLEWTGKLSRLQWKRPFIVPVEGDSMEDAGIPDGCEVLINPEEPVRNGEAAMVRYGLDNDVAIKWVYWGSDGSVEIRSATLRYPPKRFTKEERDDGVFWVCGKVMKVLGNPKRGA